MGADTAHKSFTLSPMNYEGNLAVVANALAGNRTLGTFTLLYDFGIVHETVNMFAEAVRSNPALSAFRVSSPGEEMSFQMSYVLSDIEERNRGFRRQRQALLQLANPLDDSG